MYKVLLVTTSYCFHRLQWVDASFWTQLILLFFHIDKGTKQTGLCPNIRLGRVKHSSMVEGGIDELIGPQLQTWDVVGMNHVIISNHTPKREQVLSSAYRGWQSGVECSGCQLGPRLCGCSTHMLYSIQGYESHYPKLNFLTGSPREPFQLGWLANKLLRSVCIWPPTLGL